MKILKTTLGGAVLGLASCMGSVLALEPIGVDYPASVYQLDRPITLTSQFVSSNCVSLTKIQRVWTRKEAEMESNSQSRILANSCRRVAIIDHQGAVIRGGMLE